MILSQSLILAIVTVAIICTANSVNASEEDINRTTVINFDLGRYMGQWYEIARYENRFERNLEHVTANYTLRPNGDVSVENRGYNTETGEWRSSRGKAKATQHDGKLRVSFFWIFYSDYNVLALGERSIAESNYRTYEWALVGSRDPKYLWILSRNPSLPSETLNKILEIAISRGYDTSQLKYVTQKQKGAL